MGDCASLTETASSSSCAEVSQLGPPGRDLSLVERLFHSLTRWLIYTDEVEFVSSVDTPMRPVQHVSVMWPFAENG